MILLRCYPRITDWIYFFFDQSPYADYRFLPIFSYGFFVAVGFFAATIFASLELKRREKLGLLTGVEEEIVVGGPVTAVEMAINFIVGFILFYKIIGIIAYQPELSTHKLSLFAYFFTDQYTNWGARIIPGLFKYGSIIGGVLGGASLATIFFYSKNKEKLPKPEKKKITIYPSDSMGDLVVIAAILGVLGSVFFNFLESPAAYNGFWNDPISYLFSGLSIYGGLICAGIGFAVYAKIKKFHLAHFLDSIAPGYMLANGLGRVGCQVAGDGDWGVENLAPKPDWMPQWLWSTHYQHNIINMDEKGVIPNCIEEHCHQLLNPVYPTPVYEFLMCTAVFLILWALRKRLTNKPFMLFTIFMMLIGIQRYSIEQWRAISDRELYHVLGFALKQSEIISIVLFMIGAAGTAYLYNRYKKPVAQV